MRKRKIRGSIDHKVLEGFFPANFPGQLMTAEVKALVGTLRISVEELIEKLLPQATARAIVPVSGYRVGSICRGESGNLYFGSNIEFPGQDLSATVHAEQAAIANAIAGGESGIKAITVSATPCGGCRQFMNELNRVEHIRIHLPKREPLMLSALLPLGFGPNDLNVKSRLMDPQNHGLQLLEPTADKLDLLALKTASKSYAPYSNCYSAVALETSSGFTFSGAYAENAAYNNSLLPMQAAIAVLIMRACHFADIKRAVLVQTQNAKIDLAAATVQTFQAISKSPLEIIYAKLPGSGSIPG
ncbi:MAG: cytidine deaminase [SAR324 cluster bacterium]|nr:cytidine deaminase [SAR324 cluster bacterium]